MTTQVASATTFLQHWQKSPGYTLLTAKDQDGTFSARAVTLDSSCTEIAESIVAAANSADWYIQVTTSSTVPAQGKRGTAKTALAIPCLFADIDVATGAHKTDEPLPPTIEDALEIVTLMTENGLAPSTVLHTGGGLHVYWFLDSPIVIGETMPRQEAESLLKAWSELVNDYASQLGYITDPIHDLPRILRIPGTLNHKYEPAKPVETLQDTGSFVSLVQVSEAVDGYRGKAASPIPRQITATAKPAAVVASGNDLTWWENVTDWRDLLEPHGWTELSSHSDGFRRWLRPGKTVSEARGEHSATTGYNGHDVLVVHSTATSLPSGANQGLTKLRVFAELECGGSLELAGREIRRKYVAAHPQLLTKTQPTKTQPDEKAEGKRLMVINPPSHYMANITLWLEAYYPRKDGVWQIVRTQEQFYTYDSALGEWQPISEENVKSMFWRHFHATIFELTDSKGDTKTVLFHPDNVAVNNLYKALIAQTTIRDLEYGEWVEPRHGYYAAFQNGILNLDTLELEPLTPQFFSPWTRPFDWDTENVVPANTLAWMQTLWPGDEESPQLFFEWAGYCMTTDVSLNKFMLVQGAKRSGKTTLAKLLTLVVGIRNTVGTDLTKMGSRFGPSQYVGKQLAVVGDAHGSGSQDTVQNIKQISGGDLQSIEFKNKREFWSGVLPTKIHITSNLFLELEDASSALTERMLLLVLRETFAGREDTTIYEQLAEELPELTRYAVLARQTVMRRGKFTAPIQSKTVKAAMSEGISPLASFVDSAVTIVTGATTAVDTAYRAYKAFCKDEGTDDVLNKVHFSRNLIALLPKIESTRAVNSKGKQVRVYRNLALYG